MPDAVSAAAGPRPEPLTPQVSRGALENLRARLRATRWPDAPEDAGLISVTSARWSRLTARFLSVAMTWGPFPA